jgi:hypothetical protein
MQVTGVEGAHWHGRFGVEMVWVQGGPRVVTEQQRVPTPATRVLTTFVVVSLGGAVGGIVRITSGSGCGSIQLIYPAVFRHSLKCQY